MVDIGAPGVVVDREHVAREVTPEYCKAPAWFHSSNLAYSALYGTGVRGVDVTRFPISLGRLSSFKQVNACPLIILVRRAS